MLRNILIYIFLAFGSLIYSQKLTKYQSSYNLNITKESARNDNFSFGIETSQGIKVLRYFVISANISLNKFSNLDKYFLPFKGEIKWYYNEVGEEFANPYLFLNAGPNIKLGDRFADGTSASLGIGVNFELGQNIYNLCIYRSSQSFYLSNESYEIESFGLSLGINF